MPKSLPQLLNPSVPISVPGSGRLTDEYRRVLSDLLNALVNRLPVTGTVEFDADASVAVLFAAPEADANYDIWFSAPDGKNYWASSKTVDGFTANASSAVTANVRYQLIRA